MNAKGMDMWRCWSIFFCLYACIGCDRIQEKTREQVKGEAQLGGKVVATVNGHAVHAAELSRVMGQRDMSANEALAEIIDERVLEAGALAYGLDTHWNIVDVESRYLAQLLLAQLEKEHSPESLDAARVGIFFEQERGKAKEHRRVMHVVVKRSTEPAKRFAAAILKEFRNTKDMQEIFEHYKNRKGLPFELVAEELPPMTRRSPIAPEFLDAVFNAPKEGPLSAPVKTSYGWHAIVLQEIIVPEEQTLAEYEDEVRDYLAAQARSEALDELLERLMETFQPRWVEGAEVKLSALSLTQVD